MNDEARSWIDTSKGLADRGCGAFVGDGACNAKPTTEVIGNWAIYLCTYRTGIIGHEEDGRPRCLVHLCASHLPKVKDEMALLADASPRIAAQQFARYKEVTNG